ncbi:MAG: fasciclin domain-containing protein [Chitinophagaceae bacterium]|nr:fasciclin domain-containing protein [Chitinophagaceae bacterium]
MLADKNLTTMMRSVKAAGLDEDLDKSGPFTVFAPSEMAFGKLGPGELAELLKPENRILLTILLQKHMVEGKINFKDFVDGEQLKTIGGKTLDVKVSNGIVTVNGATIQARDKDAYNGVVHSLDRVLA